MHSCLGVNLPECMSLRFISNAQALRLRLARTTTAITTATTSRSLISSPISSPGILTLRKMSTQTIAVLDESELKDGEMCVGSSPFHLECALRTCSIKGKKSILRMGRFSSRGLETRFMRPVHTAHITAHH